MPPPDHAHDYAPSFSFARFTGNPYRPCLVPGCDAITLDPPHDVDTFREGSGFAASCSCGEYAEHAEEMGAAYALACYGE